MTDDPRVQTILRGIPDHNPDADFSDALWSRLAAELDRTAAIAPPGRLRRLETRARRHWRPLLAVAAAVVIVVVSVGTTRDTQPDRRVVTDSADPRPEGPEVTSPAREQRHMEAGSDAPGVSLSSPGSGHESPAATSGVTKMPTSPPAGVSPTSAPSKLTRDQIVFASTRDGDYEIYVMNSDGTDVRQLTHNTWTDFAPRASPDGSRVLYTVSGAPDHSHSQIYVTNLDGTGSRRLIPTTCEGSGLVEEPRQPTEPSCLLRGADWSPDGRRIVFQDGVEYGGCETWNDCASVWLADADGSNARFLAAGFAPHWAPDGQSVVFLADDAAADEAQCDVWGWVEACDGTIHVIDIDGSNRRSLGVRGAVPQWSPDGSEIAYQWTSDVQGAGIRQVYVINSDGSNRRQVTRGPALSGQPSWSPDGSRIAFLSQRDRNWDVYVIEVDGGSERRLTTHPATEAQPDFF